MLDELLTQLKTARENLENVKRQMKSNLDEFQQSKEWVGLQLERTGYDTEVSSLEAMIKDEALTVFKSTANKQPHEKVAIKIMKKFKVLDPAKVLAWVKISLADALIFDEAKVKQYATKIGAVDGSEITEEPQAQIATKL